MPDENFLWSLFVVSQPGKSQTPRIRLWRTLKSLGAVVLRDGVYLVPQREDLYALLVEQVATVREPGGIAYLFQVEVQKPEDNTMFTALFDRSAEYAAIVETASQLRKELTTLTETRAERALHQLKRDLDAIRAIDYFPGTRLAQTEQVVVDVQEAAQRLFSSGEPHPAASHINRCDPAIFQGRTWATRARLRVDRVASA